MSRDILLSMIDADPAQPRKHFDAVALAELAQSVAANGLIVPILVRPVGERFLIVHGERRYRAAQSLGWATIPAEVRDLTPDEAQWFALVENIQRADLSPIEEARAYRAVLDTGITQTVLAQRTGKTQSAIATKLRFLQLAPELAAALDAGRISEGHAKQLLRLDHPDARHELYEDICRDHLSVKQTSARVDRALRPMTAAEQQELARLEADLEQNLTALGSHLEAMKNSLHKCRSRLTPEQFKVWVRAELHIDEATAHAILTWDGTRNSMLDIWLSIWEPRLQGMSRDIPPLTSVVV